MDLRIRKTLTGIRTAYLELAREKGIDNISVKELCDRAMINKATFYAHYEGIYALNKEIEDEAIEELLASNSLRPSASADPEELLKLIDKFSSNEKVTLITSSSRRLAFMNNLFDKVKEDVLSEIPELAAIEGIDIYLSFIYQGIAYVFSESLDKHQDRKLVADVLSECVAGVFSHIETRVRPH